ncbi:MAG TPA: MFS transporter [Candidatus Izemoplasmatales bacterium]|nr:MFS transporter [Candidatus Izemoplasmatales bacterium]
MNTLLNEKEKSLSVKQGFKNIVLLGLVSMFIDLSTEMVYPLVTIYLSTIASVAIIGVVEGLAESVAAILKSYSGYLGDKSGKKKILAFTGYFSAVIYKILLFFSFNWVFVLIAKLVDRIGKGIRTAPRDALVAESGQATLGRAFGLHKALDMFGSAAGVAVSILLLSLLVKNGETSADMAVFKKIFLFSAIPALFGLFCLLFVKETKTIGKAIKESGPGSFRPEKRLVAYLVVVFLFSIGNSSNAFLVLRLNAAGYSTIDVLLIYLVYNLVSSLSSYPLGKLSDKIKRSRLIIPAYLLYSAVYLGVAMNVDKLGFYLLFGFYGIFQSLISGAERAYIVEISQPEYKGTVLGLYGTSQGLGLLFASLIAGLLWGIGMEYTFLFGAVMGVAAALMLFFVFRMKTKEKTT